MVGDLAVEQPQDFPVQAFFAAGVAGQMLQIDRSAGHGRLPFQAISLNGGRLMPR